MSPGRRGKAELQQKGRTTSGIEKRNMEDNHCVNLRRQIGTWAMRMTLLCICLLTFPLTADAARANHDLTQAKAKLDRQFARQLDDLADHCRDQGLRQQENATRNWLLRRDPWRQYFFDGMDSQKGNLADDAPQTAHEWRAEFEKIRMAYAERLFAISQQSLDQGHAADAYRLLFAVLRENPKHARARTILGYQLVDGVWHTPFEAQMMSSGKTNHPTFGWLAHDHVHRYENGQRYFRGRWVSTADEERFRGRLTNGWRILTDHYVVHTNHSLEAGVALGRQLEALHTVWRQLFVQFYTTDKILARRIRGDSVKLTPRRKYKVVFFRNRDEYTRELRKFQPNIDLTLGIYLSRQRTAYFYAGHDRGDATLYHEASHQLFHETRAAVRNNPHDVGLKQNFWIIEGVALYMESLQRYDGYLTLGGLDAPRLQFARHNTLCGNSYLPLEKLVAMGRQSLQTDDRIGLLYSQAAGLTQFFMDYEAGQYRDALIQFITSVYEREDRPETLSNLVGESYTKLDTLFESFLNVRDEDLAHLESPERIKRLLLGRTDVSHTGIVQLRDAAELVDLNLDGTSISDESLQVIGGLKKLQELDLSNTSISDDGLRHLSELDNLRTLWLSGTSITDTGLAHLSTLIKLEQLHLDGTLVTSIGLQTLKQALPSLRVEQE